jgi:hypothetical protein
MIPHGYMAKHVCKRPDVLNSPEVVDIYSVSNCINDDFADYIGYWKHNGYWLFDSPEVIRTVARENSINVQGAALFYYEGHEMEFDGESWQSFAPESSFATRVSPPARMRLEGFDVVTFWARNAPEHSPLSCNGLAEELHTNTHCLFDSFDEAETSINTGKFTKCERGPYRIFAVYSVDWP